MVTIEQAKAVLAAHRQGLLAVPCVLGVGTSIIDSEPVILVLLKRKPKPGEWLPSYLNGVRVVPRITGEIQALQERTDRWRPSPGGVSCGHPRITAGTLAAILYLDEKPYIISNSHVIADSGRAKIGDPTIQPGTWDSGDPEEDTIGQLSFFEPFKLEEPNLVDFAASEGIPELVEDSILGLDRYPEVVGVEVFPIEAQIGMKAVKSGRTTGVTLGEVISTDYDGMVGAYPQGDLFFEDVIVVQGSKITAGGDSGAAVIEPGSGGLLGLLFAGNGDYYLACKIGNILKIIEQSPAFRPTPYIVPPPTKWIIPIALGGFVMAGNLAFWGTKPKGRLL